MAFLFVLSTEFNCDTHPITTWASGALSAVTHKYTHSMAIGRRLESPTLDANLPFMSGIRLLPSFFRGPFVEFCQRDRQPNLPFSMRDGIIQKAKVTPPPTIPCRWFVHAGNCTLPPSSSSRRLSSEAGESLIRGREENPGEVGRGAKETTTTCP